MKIFIWNKSFTTGIDDVDKQHQHLVDVINEFAFAFSENSIDKNFILRTAQELFAYGKEHFKTEEEIMHAAELDPRYITQHQNAHNFFKEEIKRVTGKSDFTEKENLRKILDFLIHWLSYHMLSDDQSMARQINSIKEGKTPEEAYQKEKIRQKQATEPLLLALNHLFETVSLRNKELSLLNQDLEQKVRVRTAELQCANKSLKKISETDPLTELANRRYAMEQIHLLWDEAKINQQPLCCFMVDVDRFKEVNDNYGHDAGDIVLKNIAAILVASVRDMDIVCRIGGDEFFVICPQTDLATGMTIAKRIRKNIAEETTTFANGQWRGSVSIGVASNAEEVSDVNALLKVADEGAYMAKTDGRNCVRSKLVDK